MCQLLLSNSVLKLKVMITKINKTGKERADIYSLVPMYPVTGCPQDGNSANSEAVTGGGVLGLAQLTPVGHGCPAWFCLGPGGCPVCSNRVWALPPAPLWEAEWGAPSRVTIKLGRQHWLRVAVRSQRRAWGGGWGSSGLLPVLPVCSPDPGPPRGPCLPLASLPDLCFSLSLYFSISLTPC